MSLVALLLAFACVTKVPDPPSDDGDGDGYEAVDDCDDGDAAVNPGATEICNEIDDNCDGTVDEELGYTFYTDADGDTFGDPATASTGCTQPGGTVTNDDDCDDTVITINPGAAELCDGLDNNCDGAADEGVTTTLYVDADGDGHGDPGQPVSGCESSAGLAAVGDDCDDTNAAINPGVVEDDCTDLNDYNCDGVSPYVDADGDGYATCADCDDDDVEISPDALELCNDLDDDCDGEVDEEGADGGTIWYYDYDGDGYGLASMTTTACDQPAGYSATGGDCNDDHRGVNPGTPEICDGFDDDCDGLSDEGC